MLPIEDLKKFLPFLDDVNFLDPKVPAGWRFPLAHGKTVDDLPEQINPGIPGANLGAKPVDKTFLVTVADLKAVVPSLPTPKGEALAEAYNTALSRYGMDNSQVFPDYFAQACHESNYFKAKVENLNYSAAGLVTTFRKYFPTMTIAEKYHRQPEKIANKVYADRMGNGPESSGDGWLNRGGGYFQLTGNFIYSLYTAYLRKHVDPGITVDRVRELVRTDEFLAIDSSLWYFAIYASLKDEAQRDALREITKSINGGYIGILDRKKLFDKARAVFA